MSNPRRQRGDTLDSASSAYSPIRNDDASYLGGSEPRPTIASFSPATLASSQPISAAKRLSTILVHQKSPLLLATPPQVTRALAYSHPFLLPLNKSVALVSWTTGDPWESFLLVAVFWAIVLYGGAAVRFAGPVILVLLLILGMYARRFSPLSSSGWSEDGGAGGGSAPNKAGKAGKAKSKDPSSVEKPGAGAGAASSKAPAAAPAPGAAAPARASSMSEATNTKHQKTLDEIVETLKEFTARCNILMEPLLELTDFLSTQRTATSATTRPALTTLFVRILMCTPLWVGLALPPLRVITARRIILVFGTIVLTWHARVVKAGRTILWRSASVRRLAALVTGLEIRIPDRAARGKDKGPSEKARETGPDEAAPSPAAGAAAAAEAESELTRAIRRARGATDAGVRFTFIIYENQRRWVGLGWTNSLFAYERAAWTDEHNNPVPPRDKFELPEVEDGSRMRWRWVDGSRWRVDGVPDEAVSSSASVDGVEGEWNYDGEGGKNGWVFYDNKWQLGRRGQDGWGRWTRRRKWYRDAELVEVDSDDESDDDDDEKDASETGTTPTSGSEKRPPALPPRPKTPTLAPPVTTAPEAASSAPDLRRPKSEILNGIREEAETGQEAHFAVGARDRERDRDANSSVLSASSRSTRFRVPSLRRRIADSSTSRYAAADDAAPGSPRSISVSAYSVGSAGGGARSRRASEAQSEDDAASLGPRTGLAISKDRRNDSWGVGDEVVMGLE